MSNSVAVLTELGGSTSHAAVVCREMAVPCIVGCGPGTVTELAGQTVTVDATNGTVYPGVLTVLDPVSDEDDALRDGDVLVACGIQCGRFRGRRCGHAVEPPFP